MGVLKRSPQPPSDPGGRIEKKPPATEILNFVCAKMLIFVSIRMFNKANYITTHEQSTPPIHQQKPVPRQLPRGTGKNLCGVIQRELELKFKH